MSTKIYHGYKVSVDKLHLAVEWFRIAMWQRVVVCFTPEKFSGEKKVELGFDQAKVLREAYAECGFHVWIDGETNEALISLFGLPVFTEPRRKGFRSWKLPSWLVEFSYWNNTDPPARMGRGAGYKRWQERGKQWDRVALDDGRWDARLTHVVLPNDSSRDVQLLTECNPRYRASLEVAEDQLLSRKKLPR